ncbi:ABC transporter permease [Blastococcus sp. SYSU D00695]
MTITTVDDLASPGSEGAATPTAAPSPSSGRELLRNSLRNKRTIIGLSILVPVVLLVLIGPWLAPEDPLEPVGAPFTPSGDGHLLGTDVLGRDVLSRLLAGGQTALLTALAATVLGVLVGSVLGFLAALAKSWGDETIMRILDVLLAFPQYVMFLVVVSMVGSSTWLTILLVALVWVTPVAKVMRGAALGITSQDFVRYSRSLGAGRWRILNDDILGNVTAPLSVEFGLRLTWSISLVAGLSFLGFGAQAPTPDWGLMIAENQVGLPLAPFAALAPVICIAILTVGTNLVTEGVAEASATGGNAL